MKIMFCIPSLGKGGAERVVSNLVNYLSKNNEVSILLNTNKVTSYSIPENVIIHELDKKSYTNVLIRNMVRLVNTKKIVAKAKPDVVISFLPLPSFRVLFLKRKLGCKIIVSDRNNPEIEYGSFPNNLLMKLLYKKADGFVFQTNQQKEFFNKEIQDKAVVIANPLKEEFLTVNTNVKKDNIIVNIGRLVKQKNQKLLINSFSKIKDKYPNYKLKIFGDGPLKKELEEQIIRMNLANRVELCGVSDNIIDELLKAKIFVLSSDYEGMPNSLMEAMSLGISCVSTDCPCGGPSYLINNKVNGLLIKVGDENSLINSLDNLLSDSKLMKKIGENAKCIRNTLNPIIINNTWKKYIEKVVKNEIDNTHDFETK